MIDELIVAAITPIVSICAADYYDSSQDESITEWVTFNFPDDRGIIYGDDKPQENITEVNVHYYVSLSSDSSDTVKNIRKALFNAGFTYPKIRRLFEKETNYIHYIFECEIDTETEV